MLKQKLSILWIVLIVCVAIGVENSNVVNINIQLLFESILLKNENIDYTFLKNYIKKKIQNVENIQDLNVVHFDFTRFIVNLQL